MRAVGLFVLLTVGTLPIAFAENLVHNPSLAADGDVIVAVIDSGIDAAHPEFAAGQIVAWWDFTAQSTATGTWMASPAPFDTIGHGTATASLVGGATLGAYPGVKLAIAKVTNSGGAIQGAWVDNAIRWAVHTVGADVISLSLGAHGEIGVMTVQDEIVREAFDAGVLVVASAGNGVLNYGVRYPSELHMPSSVPQAISVGAVGRTGNWAHFETLVGSTYSNLDPDVVAWGTDVCVAKGSGTTMVSSPEPTCHANDARYGYSGGTSFSTPLVAGWGARIMKAAMDAAADASAARVKSLLLGTAYEVRHIPYAIEGNGFVNGFVNGGYPAHHAWPWENVPNTVGAALAHASAGTSPAPRANAEPGVGATASYAVRDAFAETADGSGGWIATPASASVQFQLRPGAPQLRDAEAYSLALARGDRVQIWMNATDNNPRVNDADLYLFRPGLVRGTATVYDAEDLTASSTRFPAGGQTRESIDTRVFVGGTHTLVVTGTLVKHLGMTYTLVVHVNGVAATPTFLGDETHLTTNRALENPVQRLIG